MTFKSVVAVVLVLAVSVACQDDAVTRGIELKMKATSSESTIGGGRVAGGRLTANTFTFTEVMVGLEELEFETEEEDDSENQSGQEDDSEKVEFEGNFQVDLIAGTATPDFGLGNLQPGTYDKIEMDLAPVLSSGQTISIKFTLNEVNYEFTSNEEFEIEIENLSGYELAAASVSNILILLNLDTLMGDVSLANAEADEDGVVRINSGSNVDIYDDILDALEDSCDAGKDDDDNDEIDG